MATLRFFTDPHLGKVLISNTTPESRKRHTKFLTDNALSVVKCKHDVVCGGDLFDKFDNPAVVVRDGNAVSKHCSVVLGGNHDVENSSIAFGSLQLLSDMCYPEDGGDFTMPVYNEVVVESFEFDGLWLIAVPHHNTQELFEQALDKALTRERTVAESDGTGTKMLLLHCNYDCDHATNDSSLNLSKAKAAELLKDFDFILIGHDHNAKTDFDGKLIVMGSISPTSFGDCHVDHCFYDFDTGTKTFNKQVAWGKDRYLEVDVEQFLANDPTTMAESYDFIRVGGVLTPEQAPQMAKFVKAVWKNESGNAPFAVRVDAVVTAIKQGEMDTSAEMTMSFREKLAARLQDSPDLLEVWETVTAEIEETEQ